MTRKTVCLDLDGTLLRYNGWKGPDHFGEPLEGAVEFSRQLSALAEVMILTTRTKLDQGGRNEGATVQSLYNAVLNALQRGGIVFDSIYVGQGKPMAVAYVDDRAVSVPTNPTPEDYAVALRQIKAMLGKR